MIIKNSSRIGDLVTALYSLGFGIGFSLSSLAQAPTPMPTILPPSAVKSDYVPINKFVRLEIAARDRAPSRYLSEHDVFVTTNPNSVSNGLDTVNWNWVRRARFGETNLMVPNVWTAKPYFLLGTMLDTDGDGLPDAFETVVSRTNPQLRDSNHNGIEDGDELGVNRLPWTLEQVRHTTTVIIASRPTAVEGGTNGQFTIHLPLPAPKGGSLVQYRLHGSAVYPDEFSISPAAGSITIPAGNQTGSILVSAINNKIYEDLDRYVEITLTDCSMGPVLSYPAQVEIVDENLPAVRVMALPPRLEEPSPTYGSNAGEFYFIRDGAATSPVTLYFATSGTAQSRVNFAALPQAVNFRANERTVSLPIKPLRDVKSWVDKTAILKITKAAGYQIDPSNGVATVTIANLDIPTLPIVQVVTTISNATVFSPGQFTFTRSGPAHEPLRIYYDQAEQLIIGYQNGKPIVSHRALSLGHADIPEAQTKVVALVVPDNPPSKPGATLTVTIRAHKDYSVGPARSAAVQIR